MTEVIEAYWASDRDGVYIAIVAIVGAPSWRHPSYTEIELARVPAGRTHTGPEWPETELAAALGEQRATELGVPFHFVARRRPNDEVVRWWNRGRGHPCADCGLELDQNPAVHWFGMCYACHLVREETVPRLRVELVRDVAAAEFERIVHVLDAALYAAQVGLFHAGSRLAGEQRIWFLARDAKRAAEIADAALRDAGLGEHVRVVPA